MRTNELNWNSVVLPLAALVATSLCAQQPRSVQHSLWNVEGKTSVVSSAKTEWWSYCAKRA